MPSYKTKLKPAAQQTLRRQLEGAVSTYGWLHKPEQYCTYRLDGKTPQGWIRVKQYTNGTLYIDAEQASTLSALLKTLGIADEGLHATDTSLSAESGPSASTLAYPYAGSDESGKGDYFGPLVVAAVTVTETTAQALKALGIADSKTLTDAGISRLIPQLVDVVGKANIHISCLMPQNYNPHYEQAGSNLNTLLSKTHAHTLGQLIAHADPRPRQLVIDNFGGEKKIHAHINPLGLPLILATQAESKYVAVAAASCLARHTFVSRMQTLSQEWAMKLPLGAGPQVKQAKAVFIRQHGLSALSEVAKVHFKV